MSIHWFEGGTGDTALVGGKGASLAQLSEAGLPVPPGYCIGVDAYREFHEAAGLGPLVASLAKDATLANPAGAASAVAPIGALLEQAELPASLRVDIESAYRTLCERRRGQRLVAARSSAVCEDGASASFAGIYETYLHVAGEERVTQSVLDCYRALWHPRAVQYRAARGVEQTAEQMAVVVMAMIPAEVAGVAFSLNPLTGDDREVLINASWGLGEAVVSGQVTPDNVTASKVDGAISSYEVGHKSIEIVLDETAGSGTVLREVEPGRAEQPCLGEDDVASIVELARRSESHYGTPQDIEFARFGGEWYLLQSRPITGFG